MEVPDLTPEQCPLLPAGDARLVEEFNRVNHLAGELAQKYPALRADLEQHGQALSKVRDKLTHAHYHVGFLGTTGVGKSTTFNHLLQAGSAEKPPAVPGPGDATTSAVTRLRRSPGRNTLRLRYLTPEQFRQKREAICNSIGSPIGPGMEDEEILETLPALRAAVHAGQRDGLVKDIEALRLFLDSYRKFRSYVTDPATVEEVPYDDREKYLNHPDTTKVVVQAAPSFLLREAEICFQTEAIPANLEMFDLPGLGSQGTIDSLLTHDFLRELDGAMIFLRADQLSDQNAEQILIKLKPIFDGRWSGRVWINVAKFDGLTDDHLPEMPGKRTWFDAINEFLNRHQIPTSNLNVVSNEVYKAVRSAREASEREQAARYTLKRPRTAAVYGRFPAFKACIADLYDDGGITRLRELVTDRLAGAVGGEIRAAAEERLRVIERALNRAAEYEERRSRQSDAELKKAVQCRRTVYELLSEMNCRPAYLEAPAVKLGDRLRESFLESLPPEVLNDMPFDELEKEFPATTSILDRRLGNLLYAEVIDPLYDEVARRLRDLPAVPVAEALSTQEAWQNFADEDRNDAAWKARLPTFRDPQLFALLKGAAGGRGGFDGRAYRAVVEDKIRQVANQTVHAVRVRMKFRLGLLKRDLLALIQDVPAAMNGG
jgi:hypothetical protein